MERMEKRTVGKKHQLKVTSRNMIEMSAVETAWFAWIVKCVEVEQTTDRMYSIVIEDSIWKM